MKKYEVTNVETGKTVILTEAECITRFGKDEWPEYREGYLPHIVVCEVFETATPDDAEVAGFPSDAGGRNAFGQELVDEETAYLRRNPEYDV